MVINLNKIVIVGGGSAGWMSAASMIRAFPTKEVIVIESPDHPIIGVGESTVAEIRQWTSWLGIDEKDFIEYTDATYKMSIKFIDFYKKDYGSFHYPFGSPYLEGTAIGLNDWHIRKSTNPEIDVNDYASHYYPIMSIIQKNKISFNTSGNLGNFNFNTDTAYHFDATKFGQWLKNNYCLPRGVKLIQETVVDIKTNQDGIKSLTLTDGAEVVSDLFIDCTGFKSMLLGQALEEPWEDYADTLPNNSAWAAQIPYTDKEKEMEPFTKSTAIGNGWVWNTPTWGRLGTGYVFSDKYISQEDALQEFKDYLRSDKMTVHDPNRDADSFKYRLVKFKTGIHKNTFVKNVVAIGLSAGFIEPLESNGLFTVHEFLFKLVKTLQRETITQSDRDAYNFVSKEQYLSFKEFIAMHYALSNRDDTQYWRDISNRSFDKKLPNLEPYMHSGFINLVEGKYRTYKYQPYGGVHCIANGMNYFPVDKNTIDHWNFHEKIDYYKIVEPYLLARDVLRKKWEAEADQSPTMYEYLRDNIYNDKA